jgi:M6 family metalloprotease-like protein
MLTGGFVRRPTAMRSQITALSCAINGCGGNVKRIQRLFVSRISILAICLATIAAAAPFEETIRFTQPDGAVIELWGKGDEFYAVFETLDGYTVVFDPASKAYYYAAQSGGGDRLISTGLLVGNGDPRALGLEQHLRVSKAAAAAQALARIKIWDDATKNSERWREKKAAMRAAELAAAGGQVLLSPPSSTTTGTKVGLCLLIDFSDDPATIPKASIIDYCNGDAYTGYSNNGSVKKYFQDNSNGLLTYTNIVTAYVRMVQPKSYYNDTSKDSGTQANVLIRDAVAILKAQPNYATEIAPAFANLTVDGSGQAVACNVFYAGGNGGVWTYGLWPHSWSLYSVGAQTLATGIAIYKYQVTNIGASLAISTFCHENGHMLCGFPDIYDYEYDSMGGAGSFCLMDYGTSGANPCQICAYLKRAAGWATTIDLSSSSSLTASLSSTGDGFNRFYRYLKPGVSTEYYLLENRQKSGRDSGLPASGIAIWHVDEAGNKNNQSLTYNAIHANYEVTLVQADNKWHFQKDQNSGDTNDLFYSGNSTAGYLNRFNDTMEPKARWWNGSVAGINFSAFSVNGTNMTFAVVPAGLVISTVSPLTTGFVGVPYSQTLSATNLTAAGAIYPCTWAVVSNAPPPGLALSSSGVISGTPSAETNVSFRVQVTSIDGLSTTNLFNVMTYARRGVPYSEPFESSGNMPAYWTQEYVNGTTDWGLRAGGYSGYPPGAHGGSYNAWLYTPDSNAKTRKTKLVSPMIDFGVTTQNVQLTFWNCTTVRSADQDTLSVYYRTNATAAWTSLASYTTNVAAWAKRTVSLPKPSRTYFVAFEGVANYGYGVCVDDVMVTSSSAAPLIVTPSLLPTGYVGVAYSQALEAVGGAAPYTWTVVSNALPSGLALSSGGVISGTPSALAAGLSLRVRVADNNGLCSTNLFNMAICLAPGTVVYVSALRPDDSGDGLSWATAKQTIQGAVDMAADGCIVLVTNGVYNSGTVLTPGRTNLNRVVITRALTVRSVSGAANTIVEGAGTNLYGTVGAVRCVFMTKGALDGFTLRKGATLAVNASEGYGAGVYPSTASAEVRNCIMAENLAYSGGGSYGGVLTACTFATNKATYGGGAYSGTLTNCAFFGNKASGGGASGQGTLNNCTLSGNSSSNGGGSYYGTLRNCLLTGNTSSYGGGAYYGTLYNCTLQENRATYSGGGTYAGTLYNCIAWGNKLNTATNDVTNGTYYCSCASALVLTNGCINVNPLFVDASNVNYRLQAVSPCIDKGSNALATIQLDLAGKARIVDGDGDGTATVDMGAYEYPSVQVTVTPSGGNTAVAEGGASDTYTAVLAAQPSANVTLTVNAGAQLSTSPTSLTFTSGNWMLAQTVTVSAVDDAVSEGMHTGTVTHAVASADPNYNGIMIPPVTVAITDNDLQSLAVSTNSVTVIEGASTNMTVRLAAQPVTNVTVTVAWGGGDADLRVLVGSNLTFTAGNWGTPQTVTLSAAEDNADVVNGTAQFVCSAVGCSSVTVTVAEADDDFMLTVSSAGNGAANGGGIKDRDNAPYAISAIPAGGFNFLVWTGPDSAKVANTNAAATTITTVSAASVTANFNARPVIAQGASVMATMDEDGLPTGWSTPTIAASDADGSALAWSKVSGPGKGSAAVSGIGASPAIVYTPAANTNGLDSFVIQVADSRGGTNTVTVNVAINPVNDMPSFTKGTSPTVANDAGAQTLAGWAAAISDGDPEIVQSLTFGVTTTSNALFSVLPAISPTGTLAFTPAVGAGGTATVSVTLTDDATAGGAALASSPQAFTITVIALPGVTVTQSDGSTVVTEGEGGASDAYTVALNKQPAANVTVTVSADAQLWASPTSLTFTAENWIMAQTVTVSAVDDVASEGVHTGKVTHAVSSADTNYNGLAAAGVAALITDNDPADMNVTWDAGGASTFINAFANWNIDANPAFDGSIYFSFGSAGGTATVNTNVSFRGLTFNRDADFAVAGGGGVLTLGTGGLRAAIPAALSHVYMLSPDIVLSAEQNWCVTNNGSGVTTLIVSGSVSDGISTFGIAKSGDGVLTLAGDNRYDGLTTIAAGGALRVTHANALGSINGATSVASNGWLEVGGNVSVPEPLTLGGDGGTGNLRSTDGTNVWRGPLVRTGVARVRALNGSRLTLSGGTSGFYSLSLSPDAGAEIAVADSPLNLGSTCMLYAYGAGTVAIRCTNNVFGTLEVAGLTVRADLPGVLPAAAILSIGTAYSPNGTFDLNGNDQTVSQLKRGATGAGARLVTTAAPATLTVSGSTPTTYDGLLAGALSLVKDGSSALTLSGANTYSGSTVVSNGTLVLSGSAGIAGSLDVTVAGGTLSVQALSDVLSDKATLRIADGGGAKVNVNEGVVETVGALYLGGHRKGAGTWGASSLTAQNVDTEHFAGTGAISVPAGATATPVPVPFAWMDQYSALLGLAGGDYEAAAMADVDGDGHVAWQEYVAGSNPTNYESCLRALMSVSNGAPRITWAPDLGTARAYTVEGRTNLTEGVWSATNAGSRFFRVKVGMP